MVKTARFLGQFWWPNLAAIVCFAAIVVVGCYATGVPQGAHNLFGSYYSAFPLMELFILYFYGFALCTNNMNLALSFGAKRWDFFWGMQAVMVLYAASCWLIQALMSALPRLGGWTEMNRWGWALGEGLPVGIYPFLCVLVLILGCLSGLVMARSRAWGTALSIAVVLLMIVLCAVLFILTDIGLWEFLVNGEYRGLWTRLPYFLTGAAVLVFLAGEGVLWKTVKGYGVR